MTDIKEFLGLSAGTEGSLLIEKRIYNKLVEVAKQDVIDRSLAAFYVGPGDIPGSSIDIDLVDDNSLMVRKIAEGADFPISVASFTSTNLKPVKYGLRPYITKEMLEDSKFNQIDLHLTVAGQRIAENDTALIISDALDSAANTVSGGAAITIANISTAIQYLRNAYRHPTDMIVGNEVMNDLRNIDTFVEVNKSGSDGMLRNGLVGKIFGMNVYEVSNAGMTATSAYVIDRDWAFAIAEKRPLTVEQWDEQGKDLTNLKVSQRIKVGVLRTNAICKITTS
jgi:HK97 family phage major capsid protein